MKPSKKLLVFMSVFLNIMAVGLLVFLLIRWLSNNTATFTSDINQTQLETNNKNGSESRSFSLTPVEVAGKTLNIPSGFSIQVFARDVPTARFFTFDNNGTLYVGSKDGNVIALTDTDNDGRADKRAEIESGLRVPHAVAFYQGDLYLAEETRISVYRDISADGSYSQKNVLVDDLPGGNQLTGGGHRTRTIDIGPDEKLYVTIGSSCNVCIEDDDRRAALMRFDLDGSNGEIIATGLRNTVGFDFGPNGKIYGADMGRDQIGDDIPFEEINRITPGSDYGWPYCWGDGFANPEYYEYAEICKNDTTYPVFTMQAHSAPLGLKFMSAAAQQAWPQAFANGMVIAFHGSWNRTIPTGYKVVFIDTSTEQWKQYTLVSGWLEESAEAWGRPAGIGFDGAGNLYISDDKAGLIYRLSPPAL